jgi:hypothetical protein
MNSDVTPKELLMGHSQTRLCMLDKDELSTRKLVIEYMKAVDALHVDLIPQ